MCACVEEFHQTIVAVKYNVWKLSVKKWDEAFICSDRKTFEILWIYFTEITEDGFILP